MDDDENNEEEGGGNVDYGGIGQDIEMPIFNLPELKQRIIEKTNQAIDDDDPIMMQLVMIELFVDQVAGLLKWQDKQVRSAVSGAADETQKAVKQCLETLQSETLDSSLKRTLERFDVEAKSRYWQMVSMKSVKWLLSINIILLILTILVLLDIGY